MHNRAALLLKSVAGNVVSLYRHRCLEIMIARLIPYRQINLRICSIFLPRCRICLLFRLDGTAKVENRAIKKPIGAQNHFAHCRGNSSRDGHFTLNFFRCTGHICTN